MANKKNRKKNSDNRSHIGDYPSNYTPIYYGSEESYRELSRRRGNQCVWDDDCGSCPYFSDCTLW